MRRIPAFVYLVHFARPLHHARHYVGYTAMESVEERLQRHRSGRGARLLAACMREGIGFEVVQQWNFKSIPEAKQKERQLKRSGSARRYCPACKAGKEQGR